MIFSMVLINSSFTSSLTAGGKCRERKQKSLCKCKMNHIMKKDLSSGAGERKKERERQRERESVWEGENGMKGENGRRGRGSSREAVG